MHTIHTIGHSDHDAAAFLARLTEHRIQVLVDVRSQPYSRRLPQFCKAALADSVRADGKSYLYLGEQLGGRPSSLVRAQMRGDGYAAMAATHCFQQGIERLLAGQHKVRIALMCAERDPLDCHRALLVARALDESGADLAHIHYDGHVETQQSLHQRLLENAGHANGGDLFSSATELLHLAYRHHEARAHTSDTASPHDQESPQQ